MERDYRTSCGRAHEALEDPQARPRSMTPASSLHPKNLDIQKIHVAGGHAFRWNQLSLTVSLLQGGPTQQHAGPTLSAFCKEPDGRWILFRDANMLKAE